MTDPRHNSGHCPLPDNSAATEQPAPAVQDTSAAETTMRAASATETAMRAADAALAGSYCRAITAVAALYIPEAEAEARFAELKAQLPSRAARRMSRLGLMLSHLIGQIGIGEETVVIYGSMFGEGSTLESYLASFPCPSPLGFQSSIHPGGVEQALIFRQQPVREFFPVTASENLPLALFRTTRQCSRAERILLLGGEECGSWLHDHGLAADTNFAFALLLELPEQNPAPLGWLRLLETQADAVGSTCETSKVDTDGSACGNSKATPAGSAPENGGGTTTQEPAQAQQPAQPHSGLQQDNRVTLLDLSTALAAREAIDFCHPDEGHWSILWRHAD